MNNKNYKISIQGKIASYSHIATDYIFGKNVDLIERSSFFEVFEDLKDKKADYIVVPIENSTYGSIYSNYDNISNYNINLVGEVYVKVNFHLIANKGVDFKNIKNIYVHPVALGQIQSFVRENPQITFHEHDDTAGSVKYVMENKLNDSAGCASRFASEYYKMNILKENIHENPKNYTRFYIMGLKGSDSLEDLLKSKSSNEYKTTIQFELGEEPGSLYKSLRAFADRDISLTKIESRPIINTDWKYRFYLDASAKSDDERMKNALNELKDYVVRLNVLGSYCKGEYLNS